MEFFANNFLITLFFPIWVCIILIATAYFKIDGNKKITTGLTLLSTFIGLIFSLSAFHFVRTPYEIALENNYLFLPFENLNFYIGTLLDSTSTSFLVILMFISFLVQLYSYGYMKEKESFTRYYIYLNFFNFSMIGLLISTNLFQMYLFWELVGVASYLLIGFFYKRKDVSDSAKRVFIINRIGDFAFLLAIILFVYYSLTYINQPSTDILNFSEINSVSTKMLASSMPIIFNGICLLFIFAGFVKSAQFPMHLWLIDAMKAPSPVSALIHSATMVCMGIYLTIRIYPILDKNLLNIILIVGLITALICAFIATNQTNIKKILAYSTASQLGMIYIALGLFSIPIAIIYLIIHSFTKALLFLSAGLIEKRFNGVQDITLMGNLRKYDMYATIFWLIGALSLSGLFFGGFTSKEMLINLSEQSKIVLFIILLTSFFTTFYSFRTYFTVFERDNDVETNTTTEKSMTLALTVMCLFVILPGFLFKLSNINLTCFIAVLIGIFAIITAYATSKTNKNYIPFSLLSDKELFIPHIYKGISNLFIGFSKLFLFFENQIFEGFNNLTVKLTKYGSNLIGKMQNGNIQTYISYSILSIATILLITILIILGKGV